ncbi:methionine aminopeptidase-like isoform X2 [Sycon ciliatum]|uniref:methionine aminopeptidase-like isoform X2 n=1 Tax=Sycon ciliatum TaxID=27933 RepID=UPI0031F67D33
MSYSLGRCLRSAPVTSLCCSAEHVGTAPLLRHHCPPPSTRAFWSWPSSRPYSVVRPAIVSPQRTVPDAIRQPEYATTSCPARADRPMLHRTPDTTERMRRACQLAKSVLARGGELCKEGVTTDEIDSVLHEMILQAGAYPSPLNYRKFPKSICTSVNNVLCHGIPDNRALQNGDIVSVDITVYLDGMHGDTCATFAVGEVNEEASRLLQVAEECTQAAIASCAPGMSFSVIPTSVRSVLRDTSFNVSPNITGHGIGKFFHMPPVICHGSPAEAGVMETGMTFTIEPIITTGWPYHRTLKDKWTLVTMDHGRAAQFEHTILITDTGVEILTA